MKVKYELNRPISCPHCDKEQEGVSGDYVIPGRVDYESEAKTQCGYCDKWYSAKRNGDKIEVE